MITTYTITLRGPFDAGGLCLYDYEYPGVPYRLTCYNDPRPFVADRQRFGHHVRLTRGPECPLDDGARFLHALLVEVDPPAF